MIFDLRTYIIVGIFMIICISLMIFNFVIIYYGQGRDTPSVSKIKKLKAILCWESVLMFGAGPSHEKVLLKKLSNVADLVAYSDTLKRLKNNSPETYRDYIHNKYSTFQKLADIYSRKHSIERACYADFVSNFPEVAGMNKQMLDTLISYIYGSGVHCRVNVLRALCSIGSVSGVANALQVISDSSLFIHDQILTNELLNFKGDKEILGDRLWDEGRHWNDNVTVSVVQFITSVSDYYGETFMPVLQNSSTSTEVRAAIIRYYGEHIYEPARPVLIDFIINSTDVNLAIEAASALALYPAPDTIAALKGALSSSDWHVRYNASNTLVRLKPKTQLLEILQGESNYAREIVDYMLEQHVNPFSKAMKRVKLREWIKHRIA